METRDVVVDGDAGKQAITRAEAISSLTDAKAWSDLGEKLNVVVQSVSNAGEVTDEPLENPDLPPANETQGKVGRALPLKDPCDSVQGRTIDGYRFDF